MPFLEIIFVGLSLAVDATAVSITNGLTYEKISKNKTIICALMFGFFQALMPLIGFYIMYLVGLNPSMQGTISKYAGWIAFILLGAIGLKMILDAIKEMSANSVVEVKEDIKHKQIFIQAIATSIDALAVGFGLYATSQVAKENGTDFNIFIIVSTIMVITFVLSLLGTVFGKSFGNVFKKIAPLLGGVVLLVIGLLILIK